MFAHALASKPCSETTNMPYWGQWLLCCGWKDELNSNTPFIPEKFYEAYEEICKLCGMQLSEFEERWNVGYFASQEEKESLSSEAYKRTGEINAKFKQLNNEIREYLSNLDVLE